MTGDALPHGRRFPGPGRALRFVGWSAALLLAVIVGAGPGGTVRPLVAEDRADPAASESGRGGGRAPVPTDHRQMIDRGLAWLKLRQLPDGSFPTTPEDGGRSRASAEARTAVTALATLAFLGAGEGLRQGTYRDTVRNAVQWLIKAQHRQDVPGTGDDGYISCAGDGMSKMHGHGYATMALAEAYGTAAATGDPAPGEIRRSAADAEDRDLALRLRDAIERAVTLIQRSQSSTGGWGYTPGEGGTQSHEGSVTVCQVQALLAAANRGFRVDLRVVERGRTYMRKSQSPRTGGFKYKLSEEGFESATYALTAAGVASLFGLGEFDRTDAVAAGLRFMHEREPEPTAGGTRWFFYGTFYAVQAHHWVGGERWDNFFPSLRERLRRSQVPAATSAEDLSPACWEGRDTTQDLGNVYPTAMVLLMLEVPVGYLSIYAR